jgi:hypothetical protein
MAVFNCDCDSDNSYRPLGVLRTELLRRLGYSAQAANPPPGMTALLDSFLNGAHRMIFRSYPALRTERFFTWTMAPGERFYGIRENEERDAEGAGLDCLSYLDPARVTWAGVEDLNGTWYPLVYGIDPQHYTMVGASPGWPTRYEIRSCIEVFPAPQAAYKLRIKGQFEVKDMLDDTDKPQVDDEAVLLLALGNAKRHYQQSDAADYFTQSMTHIRALAAGAHGTARYVPGPRSVTVPTPPRFLPLDP